MYEVEEAEYGNEWFVYRDGNEVAGPFADGVDAQDWVDSQGGAG